MAHRSWLLTFLLTCALGVAAGEIVYRLAGCFSLTACRAADIEAGIYDQTGIVLLGSSVTHHALGTTPRLYGPVANLTTVGATTLAGDLAMVVRLLQRGAPLRGVVVLATPEMFGYPLTADDERRRTYFTHVFNRPEEIELFARLSGGDGDSVGSPALQRSLERRRAFMADIRNMWRLDAARRRDLAPAALVPDGTPRPEPSTADAGQAMRAQARTEELAEMDLPNASSRAVLHELAEECARRALRCVFGLEPIQASVYAALATSGQLASLRDAATGMCWIDLNEVEPWPDGAFEDTVHLSAGPWTAHYRSLLLALATRVDAGSVCHDDDEPPPIEGVARG